MTIFLLHPVLISLLALLTFAQLLVHFYEYLLIFWPSRRSVEFKEKIRLVGIVRWESIYYLIVTAWLIGLEIFHLRIFPIFFIISFSLFAIFHIVGFFWLSPKQIQLLPTIHQINRNSSVIELALILKRSFTKASSTFSYWMISIVIFDLVEIGVLFLLFYGLVLTILFQKNSL